MFSISAKLMFKRKCNVMTVERNIVVHQHTAYEKRNLFTSKY